MRALRGGVGLGGGGRGAPLASCIMMEWVGHSTSVRLLVDANAATNTLECAALGPMTHLRNKHTCGFQNGSG